MISFYVPAKTGNKNKATVGGGGPMNVGVLTDLVPVPHCDITQGPAFQQCSCIT